MKRVVQTQLYYMIPLENDWSGLTKEIDHFLVAEGSDYRAYEVLRKCAIHGFCLRELDIFSFAERVKVLNTEDEEAYYCYKNLDYNRKIIQCSIMDPSLCLKSLHESGLYFSENDSVAIDISCFTKPYFFCILKYLKDNIGLKSITIFYTEPMTYIFSRGLYYSYHSSSGPLSVMEIPGFPGFDTRTMRKVLVVLLGFDGELSSFISDEIAPDETIIVNGFPGYSPKYKDISLINNERLLSYSREKATSLKYARANNPFEVYNLLESIKEDNPDTFLNLAPLGTKPMALGVCLFAIRNPSVRIIYPLPEKYADKTTTECYRSWAYVVPLNISNFKHWRTQK